MWKFWLPTVSESNPASKRQLPFGSMAIVVFNLENGSITCSSSRITSYSRRFASSIYRSNRNSYCSVEVITKVMTVVD